MHHGKGQHNSGPKTARTMDSVPLTSSSPLKSVAIGFFVTAQGTMPTENQSGSMSDNQQKHIEGELSASTQPHNRVQRPD